MKKIFEDWKWKLYLTLAVSLIFILPVIVNWENFSTLEATMIFVFVPILSWLTLSFGFSKYKAIEKEEQKSRYAVKDINPNFYQTIKVTSDSVESTPLPSNNIDEPQKLGEIDFMNIKVPVYHDKYMENEDSAIACWQHRNADAFYTGPVFMNWETGRMTYPDGITPPEPKHEDYEMLPKFVVTGAKELNSKTTTGILNYFAKEYMRRNKSWLEKNN